MNNELTVFMPVYNCECYIDQAVSSILSQTYRDFIFYIVDDGSTDKTASIIKKYYKKDKRILFTQQKNIGLINTLNIHIPKINTPYIARMDGDDVSVKDRLEMQISFLKQNEYVGVIGTGKRCMDSKLEKILYDSQFPTAHNLIVWKLLYTAGMGHANIMMRTEIFHKLGGYNNEALHIEDYDLFLRASKITKLANLDKSLHKYRRHDNTVSLKFKDIQRKNHFTYSKEHIKNYLPEVTDSFVNFFKYDIVDGETSPKHIFSFFKELYQRFTIQNDLNIVEKKYVKKDIEKKMFKLAAHYRRHNISISLIYLLKYFAFKWKL